MGHKEKPSVVSKTRVESETLSDLIPEGLVLLDPSGVPLKPDHEVGEEYLWAGFNKLTGVIWGRAKSNGVEKK